MSGTTEERVKYDAAVSTMDAQGNQEGAAEFDREWEEERRESKYNTTRRAREMAETLDGW